MTHDQLKKLLEKNLHGMQRFPTLMYNHLIFNLSDLNLAIYEILCLEPLHDISNHIKHLYNELVHNVPNNIQERLNQIIQNSFNGNEAKNGSDYRKSLLLVGNWLLETTSEHFATKIILTICKIQKISYLPESKRNSKKILRLSNLTFLHSMFLVINLKNNSKSLTQRKLFGTYFHSISRHATD